MRSLSLVMVTLFSCLSAHAQKDFRGTVTYRLHADAENKPDAELKVLFGNGRLKIRFKDKEDYDDEELIVILDSSATYTVNAVQKTFKKRMLKLSSPAKIPANRIIAGHSTTAVRVENNGLGALLGGLMGSANTVFYVADSLYYHIPDRYSDNMEFVMVQNNRIVLGADLDVRNPLSDHEDSMAMKKNLITAEAIEVNTMAVDEAEFIIPADFADRKNDNDRVAVDSVAAIPDTTAVPAPPLKKEAQKKPARSGAPKTNGTLKAVRRKGQ